MPSSTRTQIYLTETQRRKLDAVRRREGRSLAEVICAAVDAYLTEPPPDPDAALATTFAALPDLEVPNRDEWDRG